MTDDEFWDVVEAQYMEIKTLRELNSELLQALRAAQWCAVQLMEENIVAQADAAIAKAEKLK